MTGTSGLQRKEERLEYGKLERLFVPLPRGESFGVGISTLVICIVAFSIASTFDHTWVVPIAGIVGVVSAMMAVHHLFKGAFRPDPRVSVFEHGVLIGRTFLPVHEVERVEYSFGELEHHHGLKTYSSLWLFRKKDGGQRRLALTHIIPAGDYLHVENFNSLLRRKGFQLVEGH